MRAAAFLHTTGEMLKTRYREVSVALLLLAVLIGGGLRAAGMVEGFEVAGGFDCQVEMATHWFEQPGGINFDTYVKMTQDPEHAVFTRSPKMKATGALENEKGYSFLLSLVLTEGLTGIINMARVIVRWQIMVELAIIVVLFLAGRGLAGNLGGICAAFGYALFRPSISMATWSSYYYWSIPFSALSLLFWARIPREDAATPERRTTLLAYGGYGLLMGLGAFFRLSFAPLPIAMIPVLPLFRRSWRKTLSAAAAMLLGLFIALAPQMYLTRHWFKSTTLTTRGIWHGIISGAGAYPNPFGVADSADLTAVKWAIDNGGPDLNKDGMAAYDSFMLKQSVRLLHEYPEVFLSNFKTNMLRGLTVTYRWGLRYLGGPRFAGVVDAPGVLYRPNILAFAYTFLPTVALALLLAALSWREAFDRLFAALWQGIYIVAILGIYFIPVDVHQTAYFPVYCLLWGGTLAILARACSTGVTSVVHAAQSLGWNSPGEQSMETPSKHGRIFRSVEMAYLGGLAALVCAVLLLPYLPSSTPPGASGTLPRSELLPNGMGTFDKWSKDTKMPEGWGVTDIGGKGGTVEQVAGISGREDDFASEVRGNGRGNVNFFHFTPSDLLYHMRGKTLCATVSAMSDNTVPEQISLVAFDRLDSFSMPRVSYGNSGKWEQLSLRIPIPLDIEYLAIVLQVSNAATAPAVFDNLTLAPCPDGQTESHAQQ